ncbi:metallophosphoesterase [Ligilactobacillus sp. WILCCON 0076]|uniref:Metallophosphoesterase n=1 Tax=Ligilactobacillus ubinensis TaxID=2876789 RepID=A0A9X2JM90_9LACO|nr:metallophosphoesterase [Ligilactobacillus ubinensis]MCP0887832.1 metallophosphoesterase [Ligilactobacillus ubinensis]
MMKRIQIVQLSDLHLAPHGERYSFNQQLDPLKKLESCFADIVRLPEKPEMIVLSGDLIHEGTAKDYEWLHEYLFIKQEKLKTEINVILGNHDRADAFYTGFYGSKALEHYYYQQQTPTVDYYFLDSNYHNKEQGFLSKDQLVWLDTKLQQHKEKPALIFLHHPVAGTTLEKMRFSILQNDCELLKIAQKANVRGIFSGHIHFSTNELLDGILCSTAESTAYHIDCTDLHDHVVADACGYNLISFDGQSIGVENRVLLAPQEAVMHIKVTQTDYVNLKSSD